MPFPEDGLERDINSRSKWYAELGALREQANMTYKEISDIKLKVDELRRPNHGVLIGFGTLLVLVSGGLWGLAIEPLKEQMAFMNTLVMPKDVVMEKFMEAEKDRARIQSDSDKGRVTLQNEIDDKASKDAVNRLIIDIDKRLPRR